MNIIRRFRDFKDRVDQNESHEKKRSQPNISWKHEWSSVETQSAVAQSVFNKIPGEMLINIFQYLSVHDLGQVSLVCRHFKVFTDSDEIWKFKVNKSAKILSKSYKEIYMDWMYEKYMRNAELEEVQRLYNSQMSHVACGIRCPPPKYPSRPNEVNYFQPLLGFKVHPNSSEDMTIELSFDIDKTAKEMISLLEKASKFQDKWRQPTVTKQMIIRYYRFMKLKASLPNNILLIPTLDIEMVWQTHLLRPSMYRNDCLRLFHRIIEHKLLLSDIEQSMKAQAFIDTCRLYEQNYGEEYCPFAKNDPTKPKEPKFVHPLFGKLKCLIPVYSYWDQTHKIFLENREVEHEENPFSFTEADVILDGNWLTLCKSFLNKSTKTLSSQGSFSIRRRNLGVVELSTCALKRLKKSYERFLYMAAKYSSSNEHDYVHPTYAIDIIWHSHMQQPHQYAQDCERLVGHLIEHTPWPSVDEAQSKSSCETMDKIWEQTFKVPMALDHLYNTNEDRYDSWDD